MLIFDQKWYISVTELFGFKFFIIHSDKDKLISSKNSLVNVFLVQKWYFFAKTTFFAKYGALEFARLMTPSFKNAFYSRIFVIISRLFAYNWTKCRNLRFLLEIVKIVTQKILM